MILPDWPFIRREVAFACRDFYSPFRGILDALAALRSAKLVEEGSSDLQVVLLGTSDTKGVVEKDQLLLFESDINLIDSGADEGADEERVDLFPDPAAEHGSKDTSSLADETGRIILEIEARLHRLIETSQGSTPDTQSKVLAAAAETWAARRMLHAEFGRLFYDASWDILLELFVSTLEGRKVTVSTACAAACAPTTTALRHIAYLVQEGLVVRRPHPADSRSTYLQLTPQAITRLTRYFSESTSSVKRPSEHSRSLRRAPWEDDRQGQGPFDLGARSQR